MRIAVIGAGVSGNVCAASLHPQHDVTLFEAQSVAGGHTRTLDVHAYGQSYRVDAGFMVFNDRTYPHFRRLLQRLAIESQASDMSFSVRCDRSGWEYQGSSLGGLFAQRVNLLRPSFYRMLSDILRFNRAATNARQTLTDVTTLGEYLSSGGWGTAFRDRYLIPMTAAIWSARPDAILQMPAKFLFEFFHNHGLLQIKDRPRWQTIPGGARRYVEALLAPLGDRVRVNTAIESVWREETQVWVAPRGAAAESFDAVVFACHADQVVSLLRDTDALESEVLGQFGYQANRAVVHTDASWLPRRRAAWASWNYRITEDRTQACCVTYDVNRLQRLGAPGPICVTLNPPSEITSPHLIESFEFQHPVFRAGAEAAQRRQRELNGRRRTFFSGAYWGYGFHEDGVRSALAACEDFARWSHAS